MLNALTDVASWSRMKFKACKSRSLNIMKKDNTTDRFVLRPQNEDIPSILNNPYKCLGNRFDASLQGKVNVRMPEKRFGDGRWKKVDNSILPSFSMQVP